MKNHKRTWFMAIFAVVAGVAMVLGYQNCGPGLKSSQIPFYAGTEPVMATQAINAQGNRLWWFLDVARYDSGYIGYYNWNTWVHIVNPHEVPVQVNSNLTGTFTIGPTSRYTVHAQAWGFHAVYFQSLTPGREIYVSKSNYAGGWSGSNWAEASAAVVGLTEASPVWHFGEGGTMNIGPGQHGLQNFYDLYNPNGHGITVEVTYLPDMVENPHGIPVHPNNRKECFYVAPYSRGGFNILMSNPGFWDPKAGSVSTTLRSTDGSGFYAALTMYSQNNVGGWDPWMMTNQGTRNAATTWYYTDVATIGTDAGRAGFHNRLYTGNPNPYNCSLTFNWRDSYGNLLQQDTTTVYAMSRLTFDFNYGGWGLRAAPQGRDDMTLEINSSCPVACTKINYWARQFSWTEGAMTIGSSRGSNILYIPTGSNFGGFTPYVNVMNVSGSWASFRVTGYRADGVRTESGDYWIAPKGLVKLHPHMISGILQGFQGDFSLRIVGTQPLVAELSQFYGWRGDYKWWAAGDSLEAILVDGNGAPIQ